MQDVMTRAEVAELFRVHKGTIKRWDKQGKFKAIQINKRGDRRYLRVDVEEYINAINI